MLQKFETFFLLLQEPKKSWMDSDSFEDWVREQDNKFEGQNRKVLLILDNFLPTLKLVV